MGQKTNPNVLRLGLSNNVSNSKYFFKTTEESSLLIYQELQIKNFVTQFLNKNGFRLYDCKIEINDSTLFIWSSYFTTSNFLKVIKVKNVKIKNKKIIRKKLSPIVKPFKPLPKVNQEKKINQRKYSTYKRCLKYKHFRKGKFRKFKNPKKFKRKRKIKKFSSKKKFYFFLKKKYKNRLILFKKYQNYFTKKKYSIFNEIRKNTFVEKLLQGLNLFTKSKYNIYLNLQNLNSSLSTKILTNEFIAMRKILISFKQYWKQQNFLNTINTFLISIKMQTSAHFIADYISKELKNYKRHNKIFTFFKQIIYSFFKISFSKINGIKILIKGRFNSAPRAKKKLISVGHVPAQTLNAFINYSQKTSYSKNGTFGIKVWLF